MTEPYPFAPVFERDLVALLVRSSGAYSRFADHLEDDAFTNPLSRIVLGGLRSYYEETGRGTGSTVVLVQRLRWLHEEGQLAMDDLVEAIELLMDLDELSLPDEQDMLHELARVVRRRIQARNVEDGIMAFAQRGDLREIARRVEATESIGEVDMSVGDDLSSLADDLDGESMTARMSTGCDELDAKMGGGLRRGDFAFFLGPPKTGKSLKLNEQAVIGVRMGLNVALVSLELRSTLARARFLGGLTGTPSNDIIANPRSSVAFQRLDELTDEYRNAGRKLGRFKLKKMPPGSTGLVELFDYVRRLEDAWGEPVDCLVIDYPDKMRGSDTSAGMYEQMREVYEGLRTWAEDNQRWCWGASQPKGHVQPGDMPRLGDCADSQHKIRTADAMFGLQKHVDGDRRGKVSIQLVAGRSYEETPIIGPYVGGASFGTFFEAVACPGLAVQRALMRMGEDGNGVFS